MVVVSRDIIAPLFYYIFFCQNVYRLPFTVYRLPLVAGLFVFVFFASFSSVAGGSFFFFFGAADDTDVVKPTYPSNGSDGGGPSNNGISMSGGGGGGGSIDDNDNGSSKKDVNYNPNAATKKKKDDDDAVCPGLSTARPLGRHAHASAYIQSNADDMNALFIFGGRENSDDLTPLGDLW